MKGLQGWIPLSAVRDGQVLLLCLHTVCPLCVCVSKIPIYKYISYMGLGSTLMTSL